MLTVPQLERGAWGLNSGLPNSKDGVLPTVLRHLSYLKQLVLVLNRGPGH